MKNHYLFLVACGLFFVGTPLFAQKTVVFKTEEKKTGIYEEINQILRDYQSISLNVSSFYEEIISLKKDESVFDFTFLYQDQVWQVKLSENKFWELPLSTNISGNPNEDEFKKVQNTFFLKGYVNNNVDNSVRLTVTNNFINGYVETDEERYKIESINKFVSQKREDLIHSFIIYKESDIIDEVGDSCLALEPDDDNSHSLISKNEIDNQVGTSSCSFLHLALDADFEYFQVYGANTTIQMLGMVNQFENIYDEELGIRILVTHTNFYNNTAQPYTSTVPLTLLNQFRDHWNNNNGNTLRSVAHLFTGKVLPGFGIAYVGVVCSNPGNSYALSAERPRMFQTVAHEIGHTVGATHPPDVQCFANRTIMCQGDFKIMEFSPFSIDEITNYVSDNSSCMAHYMGSISILGPNALCTSDTYEYRFQTFSNISWSVTPANLFSSPSSGNGPVANLTRANPSVSGDATLTYTIEGECGNFQLSRTIRVGTPNDALIVTASHWGPPIVREIDASTTTFAEATYNQVPVPGGHTHFIEEYEWDIWDTHSNWSIIPQHGGGPPFNADVEIDLWHNPLPAQQTIYVRVRNPCGWSLWQETFWDVVGGCSFCAFTVYPNPAAETLHIRLDHGEGKPSGSKSNLANYTIGIYSENGNLVWQKETDSTEEHIPTAAWKEGIYHVRIHHPEGNYSQKVIIRH